MKYSARRKVLIMNANLKAVSVCFIVDKVCSVKCLVVNYNVNNVYLMMLCSMSLLQFSSHQFFRSHWSYWYKKPTEVKESFFYADVVKML